MGSHMSCSRLCLAVVSRRMWIASEEHRTGDSVRLWPCYEPFCGGSHGVKKPSRVIAPRSARRRPIIACALVPLCERLKKSRVGGDVALLGARDGMLAPWRPLMPPARVALSVAPTDGRRMRGLVLRGCVDLPPGQRRPISRCIPSLLYRDWQRFGMWPRGVTLTRRPSRKGREP
jgi:hypothetical protein